MHLKADVMASLV